MEERGREHFRDRIIHAKARGRVEGQECLRR